MKMSHRKVSEGQLRTRLEALTSLALAAIIETSKDQAIQEDSVAMVVDSETEVQPSLVIRLRSGGLSFSLFEG